MNWSNYKDVEISDIFMSLSTDVVMLELKIPDTNQYVNMQLQFHSIFLEELKYLLSGKVTSLNYKSIDKNKEPIYIDKNKLMFTIENNSFQLSLKENEWARIFSEIAKSK